MKKGLSLLLVLCLILGTAACGQKPVETSTAAPSTAAPQTTQATEAPTEPAPTEPAPAFDGDTYKTGAAGTNGAAACASSLASDIAVQILEKGGNAVDAAVAMIYAVGLLEPAASGMGGAGQMVIYLAETNEYVSIEYMTQAPAAALPGALDVSTSSTPPSVEAIAIPGVVHGTLTALEKFCTMSAAEVLQPVIDLARNGFPCTARWNTNIEGRLDNLKAYDYTLGLYTDEGFLYEVGDTIKNPDLADTLEMLAKDGIKGFYDSEFTDKMVSHIQSLGGVLTHEDFAQYKSVMRDPLSTTYNGYTVYTTGGPSNGGVALLEALNILEHFDLKSYGFDSPETVQIMADAYAMAYQDGVSFMGDPDYYDLPVETIISKEYAEERAKAITPGERIKTAKAGRLTVTLSETGQKVLDDCTPDQGGTTHLVCADKFGNVVSTTNTNGINFGSAVAVPGTGFVFSAHLGNLNNSTSARVNMVMPYIRVRSTTCPTIVAGPDGKPVLAIGSPGNWALVSAAIEGVVNYATFGMGLGNVINSPRSYRDGISKNLTIESGYSETTLKKLEEMGFVLEDQDKDFSSHVGSLAGIQINSDGSFWALGDFRRNYGASAY